MLNNVDLFKCIAALATSTQQYPVAEMGDHLATIDMGQKLGAVPLLVGRSWVPCNIMWRGPKPTFVPSGILIHPAVWPQQLCAKNWGAGLCPLFGEESWVPIWHNVAWAEAYLHIKWHLDPCSCVATIEMSRKLGAQPPFWGAKFGSLSNTMLLGSRPTYLHTKWHLDPCSRLGTIDMGCKLGDLSPF